MRKILFNVDDQVCDECALALRRFIGHLAGIETIDVENRKISITFDPTIVNDEGLIRITTESAEKLGHRLTEHLHIV